MAEFEVDERVDITDVVCPMTFVKAKVAMEELEIGQVLAVTMNDGEPVQNVPRSFKEEGQQVLKLIDNENGTYDLIVKMQKSLKPKFLRRLFRLSLNFIRIAVFHVNNYRRF